MSSRSLATAARVLFGAAAASALGLSISALARSPLPGCGDASGCDSVLQSAYASFFGLPVALAGLFLYTVCLLLLGSWVRRSRDWNSVLCGAALAISALGALWFTGVQFFILKSFCPWCLFAQACAFTGVLIALLARVQAAHQAPDYTASLAGAASRVGSRAFRNGVITCATLAGGALLWFAPRLRTGAQVVSLPADAATEQDGKTVKLHGGKFRFELAALPMLGNPDTRQTAVLLTDFTCDHCRAFHRTVTSFLESNKGDAFAVLPAWRSPEGREIQTMMMTLHAADPAAWKSVADAIYSGELPATPEMVSRACLSLAGDARWAAIRTERGAAIEELLVRTRAVQDANREAVPGGNLPQLMAGSDILVGHHDEPDRIITFLAEGFAREQRGETDLVAVADAVNAYTRPALGVRRPVLDIGEVEAGKTHPFTVEVENRGRVPFKLGWLSLEPGCEVVSLPGETLAPGAQDSIGLSFFAPETAREFERHIRIHTTANGVTADVILRGKVRPPAATASSQPPAPR